MPTSHSFPYQYNKYIIISVLFVFTFVNTSFANDTLHSNPPVPFRTWASKILRQINVDNMAYGVVFQKQHVAPLIVYYNEYAERYFPHCDVGASFSFTILHRPTIYTFDTFMMRNITLFGYGNLYRIGAIAIGAKQGVAFNYNHFAAYFKPVFGIRHPFMSVYYEPMLPLSSSFSEGTLAMHQLSISLTLLVGGGPQSEYAKLFYFNLLDVIDED